MNFIEKISKGLNSLSMLLIAIKWCSVGMGMAPGGGNHHVFSVYCATFEEIDHDILGRAYFWPGPGR